MSKADTTRTLLEDNIKARLEYLSNTSIGSKEEQNAVTDIEKLYRLKIEEDKFAEELIFKRNEATQERLVRSSEELEKRRNNKLDLILKIASGIAAPLFYTGLYVCGLAYETEGCITTKSVQGVIKQMPCIFKKQK